MPEKPLRVATETVPVVLRTHDRLVVGHLHVQPNKRLKDELNLTSDRYIALTDVRVYDADGARLDHQAAFMLVASAHIVSVTPTEGITGPPDVPWLRHGR